MSSTQTKTKTIGSPLTLTLTPYSGDSHISGRPITNLKFIDQHHLNTDSESTEKKEFRTEASGDHLTELRTQKKASAFDLEVTITLQTRPRRCLHSHRRSGGKIGLHHRRSRCHPPLPLRQTKDPHQSTTYIPYGNNGSNRRNHDSHEHHRSIHQTHSILRNQSPSRRDLGKP